MSGNVSGGMSGGTSGDAFTMLAHALRERWLANGGTWPDGSAGDVDRVPDDRIRDDRTRNVLLDACGSDYRALVELVLSVGEEIRRSLGVSVRRDVDANAESAARVALPTNAAWEVRRAPLVHRLVATRYLQTDIARWLIDTWAHAVGQRDVLPSSPTLERTETTTSVAAARVPESRRGGLWRGAASPVPRSTTTVPAATTLGGARAPGVYAGSSGASYGGRSRMTPAELAKIKRMERTGLILLTAAGVFSFVAHGYAMWSKPLERERAAASPVNVGTNVGANAGVNVRTTTPVIVGTEANTDIGTTSHASVATTDHVVAVNTNGLADATAERTVSGRYRVTHHATSVTGGDGCDMVAGALARQEQSVETVEQSAGTSTIRLVSRGIEGAVQPDGEFLFGPDSGVTDGVRWTFVMRGRFTPSGFVAHSQKTTNAIVKWNSLRACAVVAELFGTRLSQ